MQAFTSVSLDGQLCRVAIPSSNQAGAVTVINPSRYTVYLQDSWGNVLLTVGGHHAVSMPLFQDTVLYARSATSPTAPAPGYRTMYPQIFVSESFKQFAAGQIGE